MTDYTNSGAVIVGATPTDATTGSVLFAKSNKVDQDNINLFWDDTNNRLGIGTNSPTSDLTVYKNASCKVRVYAGPGGVSSFDFFEGTPTTDPDKDGFRIKYDGNDNVLKIHAVANQNEIEGRGLSIGRDTGNVGIGTITPNANALLDMTSTTKAFMPPRMTTAQKNAVSTPTAGMVVYDSNLNKLCVYTGAAWETITSI